MFTAQVYFVLCKYNKFEIKLANIEGKNEPELLKTFLNELIENIINDENLKVCSLSSADEYPNTIYLYDYDGYLDEMSIFKDFNINATVHYDKFNFYEDSLSDLFGYIICLESMSKGISFFKKYYPVYLVKQDSFLLSVKKTKSVLLRSIQHTY